MVEDAKFTGALGSYLFDAVLAAGAAAVTYALVTQINTTSNEPPPLELSLELQGIEFTSASFDPVAQTPAQTFEARRNDLARALLDDGMGTAAVAHLRDHEHYFQMMETVGAPFLKAQRRAALLEMARLEDAPQSPLTTALLDHETARVAYLDALLATKE